MGMAAEMGGTIFLSNYLGKWLASEYQKPSLEDITTLIGVFLAMFIVIYRVIRFSKK